MASYIDLLLRDFRQGTVDPRLLEVVQRHPHKAFRLDESTVRPPLLKHEVSLDTSLFRRIVRRVRARKEAFARMGTDWMPVEVNSVETKDGDDVWVTREDLKSLDDVCTRFCTYKYFPDAFSRINMIVNMTLLYEEVARVYPVPFQIMFKGGVMIRLIILEFLADLELQARMKLINYLTENRALSISDFDFEIVATDHHLAREEVHCMTFVNYLILLWLQDVMEKDFSARRGGLMDKSWDFKAGAEELKAMLQEEIDQNLDPDHKLKGCKVDHVVMRTFDDDPPKGYKTKNGNPTPAKRRNLFIFRCPSLQTTKGGVCVVPCEDVMTELRIPFESRVGNHFYANLNMYIGEGEEPQRSDQLMGLFHLARIKHSFTMYYTTPSGEKRCDRLAGEMIDLSQSHGLPSDKIHGWLYKRVPEPYTWYWILSVPKATLKSYTIHAFYLDHRTMIHHGDKEPSKVKKVGKRLLRYVCFFVAHVLSHGPIFDNLKALKRLHEAVRGGLKDRTLRTGNAAVDEFYAVEMAASEHDPEYLNKLASHCDAVIGAHLEAFAHTHRFSLDRVQSVHMEHADEVYYT